MRTFILSGFFLLVLLPGTAKPSAAQGLPAKWITSFPFKQYSGGVMVVTARLNDRPDTLRFILDTGSGGISLDSTTCVVLGLATQPTDTVITGIGGSHRVQYLFNQSLHFPGLAVDSLDFHVNDYNLLSSVYGEKIDGIIGYSFFSRYIVAVDFDQSVLSVFSPGEYVYPRGGHLLKPAFTNLPIQQLTVRDERKLTFGFYFDSGAGLYFLMSEKFATDSAILCRKRKFFTTQAEGMGGKMQMQLTIVRSLRVGPYTFKAVPTYIFRDVNNVTSYPFVGGLLGNDLLRRFNLVINYPARQIHLKPNGHFHDQFDYSYTGLSIYDEAAGIVVDEVIKGSPAEKAGLLEGDIVIGVGNSFSGNIMQYKELLQSAGQRIPLLIRRGSDLKKLYIKPVSIR